MNRLLKHSLRTHVGAVLLLAGGALFLPGCGDKAPVQKAAVVTSAPATAPATTTGAAPAHPSRSARERAANNGE